MAHIHKGQLTRAGEWWRHLRPYNKRAFWKGERKAGDADATEQANEISDEAPEASSRECRDPSREEGRPGTP